jgi:hypothetical protein
MLSVIQIIRVFVEDFTNPYHVFFRKVQGDLPLPTLLKIAFKKRFGLVIIGSDTYFLELFFMDYLENELMNKRISHMNGLSWYNRFRKTKDGEIRLSDPIRVINIKENQPSKLSNLDFFNDAESDDVLLIPDDLSDVPGWEWEGESSVEEKEESDELFE